MVIDNNEKRFGFLYFEFSRQKSELFWFLKVLIEVVFIQTRLKMLFRPVQVSVFRYKIQYLDTR